MLSFGAIERLRRTAAVLSEGDVRESLLAVQASSDVLDGVRAELVKELGEQRLFEADGASSTKTWMRTQLRVGATETSRLTRAGDTLRRLPAVADAIRAGRVRLEHVNVFSYGLKHIGDDVVTASIDWLLGVATTSEPGELFAVMKQLRDAIYPDELDEQWARGADKQHFSVEPVPLGHHVSGFLPTEIGAKLRLVLDSLAAPKGEDDTRSTDQRNVDAVDDLASAFLESGLPSDKGVRPHLSVRVDAETVDGQPGESAALDGFGPIGPKLLACTADVTPVLTQQGLAKGSIVLSVERFRSRAERSEAGAWAPAQQRRSRWGGERSEPCAAPCGVVVPWRSD